LLSRVGAPILGIYRFPEYWFFRNPAPRSALIKARLKVGPMRVTFARAGASAACLVLAVSTVSSAELTRYREFELGTSLASVTAVTHTQERDLKTIHSRPAVLQQLEWRPRYMSGTPVPGRDSIDRLVFDFVDDRLFKMSVVYAQDRTSGLTNQDMIESLSGVYGAPLSARKPGSSAGVDAPVIVAEWRQADASLVLQRQQYSNAYVLVVTSLSLDAVARKAEATALVLDEREAPQREAALAKKRVDDERQAEAVARSANKKVFQP
jgi:hypothetical protein